MTRPRPLTRLGDQALSGNERGVQWRPAGGGRAGRGRGWWGGLAARLVHRSHPAA